MAFAPAFAHAIPLPSQGDRSGMAVTIYGIKNCDTMKKARSWLEDHDVAYEFHDYKALGIDRTHLEAWIDQAGLDTVLNRAGTTFRKLPDAERENLTREKAITLMLDQPSMIKRPVLEAKDKLVIGFKPEIYTSTFGG
jgi:Spx/MgsR family transcriptional regulator